MNNKNEQNTYNNKHIINTIDEKKKSNFKNRSLISVFVFIFYGIVFLLSAFSDNTEGNWMNGIVDNKNIKGIFAIFMILTLYIPLYFCIHESLYLVFDKNQKKPLYILTFFSSFLYFGPLIFLIITNYFISYSYRRTQDTDYNLISLYLIYLTLFFCLLLIIIFLNIFLKKYQKMNFKNALTMNILLILIPFGFFGFAMIGLLRGWYTLVFLFISIAGTDVMCYLSGLLFGKHKMAKVISPNKTWEGAILGTILTVFLLLSYCGFLTLDTKKIIIDTTSQQEIPRSIISLWNIAEFQTKWSILSQSSSLWIILFFVSLGIVISSILGDLLFSYIKRQFNIKDFGTALKSHGGFLDRFDSFIFTSTVYFLYTLTALGIFALSRNIDIIFGKPII